jgi:hypothetical protein
MPSDGGGEPPAGRGGPGGASDGGGEPPADAASNTAARTGGESQLVGNVLVASR